MAKSKADPRVDALVRVDLFAGLTPKQLGLIAVLCRDENFSAGATIVAEGETSGRLYVIVDGTAEVRLGTRKVATIGGGDYFGEMAVIDKGPRSASVVATEPTSLLSLAPFNVRAVLRDNPDISLKLLERLSARLRASETNSTH